MIRLFCILSLLTFAMVTNAQTTQDEPYEFPIKPGTEAWKKFASGQEMKDACQVPNAILLAMTTEALVKTCLAYPLIGHITAYNDLQTGTEAVITEFNGFQELMKRPDAAAEIMESYLLMNPNIMQESWPLLKKGQFAFEFLTIELLLAQPTLYNKLSNIQKKELVAHSLSTFKEKDARMEVFGGNGLSTSALVMGRILNTEGFPQQISSTSALHIPNADQYEVTDKVMNQFLGEVIVTDTKVIDNVVVRAQLYLNQ